MAYKRPINPDDPYDPQAPVDEPAPEGPAAPTDPYAPVAPAPPPVTTDPAYPKPGADPVGTPLPNEPDMQYLGGSRSFDERTGTYRTVEEMNRLEAERAAQYANQQWNTGGYARPGFISTTYNQNAVSGYDPAKWADPLHQTPKYVVGRILSGYNLNDPTQLQAAMADIAKAYPGTTWAGKDVVNIPGIGNVDVIRDFGGESGIAWQPEDGAAPAGGALAHGSLGGGTSMLAPSGASSAMQPWYQQGQGTSSMTGSTTASSGSSDPALENARRAALLDLLGRKPPTAEELRNTPENQAYMLQAQRAEERQRAELAERAAYEGFGNSGYFDTELQGIRQQRGEGEAGFLGELAVSRMQAQREDLQFAISEAQQAGQFDLAQQLQRESMNLDAAIRREQMASSEKMAANDLALREFLGRAGIDLDRLRLGEDQRQFNYDLGYRYSNLDEQGRQFDLNYVTPR